MRSRTVRHIWRCRPHGLAALLLLAISPAADVAAQVSQRFPAPQYYLALAALHEGEFVTAGKAFRSSAQAGVRTPQGRWVDSICYASMMGECDYQLGNRANALEQFTTAVNLFLQHPAWLTRVQLPDALGPETQPMRTPISWGRSTRRTVAGAFRDQYLILTGNLNNQGVVAGGGVFVPAELQQIDAIEIVRCTAHAIRRRGQLLGRTGQFDPVAKQLILTLQAGIVPPAHWSQAWSAVLLGLAYESANQPAQAIVELTKGLTAAGQYDHPLTPVALLHLGRLAIVNKNYADAANLLAEATYSAAWFGQYLILEEAFQQAAAVQLASNQPATVAYDAAAAWSRRQSAWLEASLTATLAELAVVTNNAAASVAAVDRARRLTARSEMSGGYLGARFQYLTALTAYQSGNLKAGDAAFLSLMTFQRRASARLFELSLADQLYASGATSDREASNLYEFELRDPTAEDWAFEPVESLTMSLAPHAPSLENWFYAAIKREAWEQAVEIGDRLRRHRYFQTLSLGGRLVALRWIMSASEDQLPDAAKAQRNLLTNQFPAFAELARESARHQARLRELPVAGDDANRQARTEALNGLIKASVTQELLLRQISLRRVPSEMVMPPLLKLKDLRGRLPADTTVLAYLFTSRGGHRFVISTKAVDHQLLEAPTSLRRDVAQLLEQFGNRDRHHQLDPEALRDAAWRDTSAKLASRLLPASELSIVAPANDASRADESPALRRRIVVPDGLLWYVPFEALLVKHEAELTPWFVSGTVRYAPQVSLLQAPRGQQPADPRVAVAPEAAAARLDETDSKGELGRLLAAHEGAFVLPDGLESGTTAFLSSVDQLLVLAESDVPGTAPAAWQPIPPGKGKFSSTLDDWTALPWYGPTVVAAAGLHTAAETALRSGGDGSDLFLISMGLASAGTHTALLSRWRTGGKSSRDLLTSFVRESTVCDAPTAWQRSILSVMNDKLFVDREPRLKADSFADELRADHPFFWSGFLLWQTGL